MVAIQHLPLGLAAAGPDEEALVRAIVEKPPQRELDLAVGQPQAEVVARHGLQRVGLVEDHDVVPRQHRRAFHAEGQVGEIECVVDHHDLGPAHPPPGRVVEAVGVVRALAAHAVGVVAGHFFPYDGRGLEAQVGQRAVAGLLRPGVDLAKLLVVFLLAEQRAARPIAFFIRRRLM